MILGRPSRWMSLTRKRICFFDLLTTLVKNKHLPVYLLICLDSMDLEAKLSKEFNTLKAFMDQNRFVLPKLNQAELSGAIVNPAHKEGGGIEESVIDFLIEELSNDEDQLRKLQLYMHRTWFEYLRTRKKGAKLDLQHLNRANGLKSKAKVRKKGISMDELMATEEGAEIDLDGNDDFNSAFLKLQRADQQKFQKIVSILMTFETLDPNKQLSAEQLMKASGADKTDYNRLRNKFLSLFHTDSGKVKIYKDAIPDEWKDWIYQEVEAAQALEKLVKYAIDHYINGRDLFDIQTKSVLDELTPLTIFPKLTLEWASVYSEQHELALDLWEKLKADVPKARKISIGGGSAGKVSIKSGASSAKGKKISIGKKGAAVEKPEVQKDENLSEDEAIAKLLAGGDSSAAAAPKKKLVKRATPKKIEELEEAPATEPAAIESSVIEVIEVIDGAELDDLVAGILADEDVKPSKSKPRLKIKTGAARKAKPTDEKPKVVVKKKIVIKPK